MSHKILVLHPSGHLDRAPSIKYLSLILAKEIGFRVEVLTLHNITAPKPAIAHPNVMVRNMPWLQQSFFEPIFKVMINFLPWALMPYLRGRYDCIIGTGIRGLYIGAALTLIRRVPLVYHSLELYPSWERDSFLQRIAKAIERWANCRCTLTIIQDELRASLLSKDNMVSLDRIVLMPNAPPGKASLNKSTFLRERFNIPTDKKILLFAGTIFARWAPTLSLVHKARQWPDKWVLVLHSNASVDKEFLNRFRSADPNERVVLSCDPLPSDQLRELVSSADIGLAIYEPTDDNMLNMGLSSGKIAEYLKSGLPIVISNLRGTADIVKKYNCGVVIDKLEGIEDAIRSILMNYEMYSESSVRCFNEVWSLDNYSSSIAQAFLEVVGGK